MTPEIHSPTCEQNTKRTHTINTARLVGKTVGEHQADLNCITAALTGTFLHVLPPARLLVWMHKKLP
jgi:hypothetical protein